MLELNRKTLGYGKTPVVEDVHLRINDGDRIALRGSNGSGKSTLLRAILEEAVRLEPKNPGVVFLPQELPSEFEMSLTAHDYVMLGRTANLSAWKRPSQRDEEIVLRAIESVGLAHCARKRLLVLSGGQRRRLSLALALASEAKLVLLDEPMAHIDVESRGMLFDALLKSHMTIVMSIHDATLPSDFFTREILIESGHLVSHSID